MNKHTGTSMSKIYNTNKIKALPCDCSRCYHAKIYKQKGFTPTVHCTYRDIINPTKKVCARYKAVRKSIY